MRTKARARRQKDGVAGETKGPRRGSAEGQSMRCGERSARVQTVLSAERRTLTVHVPLKLHRRGGRKLVVSPNGVIGLPQRSHINNTLVKALVRAHRWQKFLENGTYPSVAEIAKAEQINDSYVGRVLRLTLLAPEIIESVLDSRHPPGLQAEALLKPIPVEWARQRATIAKLARQDYDR